MDSDKVIPGFTLREEYYAARRRIMILRWLVILLPLIPLIVIDVVDRGKVLVPLIALLPFLDLHRQLTAWYFHIRRFGFPPLRHCRLMLRLDSLRGYDPTASDISQETQRNIALDAGLFVSMAAAFVILWRLTGISALAYVGAFLLMLAIKGVIRRARPPSVLLLGASGLITTRFLLRVMQAAHPMTVVACVHHDPMAPLIDETLLFFSYRTVDDSVWRYMVHSLVSASPLVVLDARRTTSPVDYEITCSLELLAPDQLFSLPKEPEHPAIPRDRSYSEGELIEALYEALWPGEGKLARRSLPGMPRGTAQKPYRDERNGYFAFVPPPGWTKEVYDDPRTKLVFTHPGRPEVHLRVLVRRAQNEGHAPPASAVAQALVMGFDCCVSECELLGVPCSEIHMQSPAGQMIMWLFVLGGLHFNVEFAAPGPNLFNRHVGDVRRSLETITVLAGLVGDGETARRESLANRLRYARLAAENISIYEAKQCLLEALTEFHGDEEATARIQELLDEIDRAG